ncbi:MAG TPA: DICT sensory domain-containing protein [Pyrinomonadaceae bacterium]|nr:DICT sensory domain-containing protein [Pyrinomonadaceae bacterium]
MKDFSLYEHALEIVAHASENLGDLALVSRRDYDERATFRFRAKVPCLEYISLLIESAVLLRANRAGRVYVGFEKLSCMEPIADRFMRIADLSERLYVFGETDWQPPRHPNLRLVQLNAAQRLAREWFVIVNSPTQRVALVARDEDGFDAPDLDERTFSALKTSAPAHVEQLASAAEDVIDSSLAG